MNLPASAMSFLPSFIGLYAGHETLFFPHTRIQLPLIHLYCFVHSSHLMVQEQILEQIRGEIAAYLSCDEFEEQVIIKEVRKVAPRKVMYHASFRLPAEVAFRQNDKRASTEMERGPGLDI